MKIFRKLVSVVAAATVLTSSLAFTFSAGAANIAPEEDAVIASSPNLQTNPQNGVILHAFNWSYNSIKDNLPAIKAAGYSTVQTSPVQQPKDYGASASVGSEWWKPYQPVSHQIAQKSWYGTKADLTALCAEAEKYGIKIICDIVSNHVGNNDSDTVKDPFAVSPQVKTYQPNIYAASAKNSQFYHNVEGGVSDGDVKQCVQGHLTACPDLNTANSTVQNNIINLLKECIDCGVDGFRFDGAKHIETPSDGSYASQFWPNVTSAAKTYYKNKTGGDLYMYGEILNNCGPSSRQYSHYTPYIKVTDNRTGDAVTAAVKNKNAGQAASSSYKSGAGAGNIVLWTESHDTYEGEAGSAGISNTSSLTDDVITKSWALVAARKDSTALFFARPAAKMGQASSNTTYKSAAVSEVNKFKNAFVGQSEYLGSSGSIAYVRRGTTGIVLSNVGGAEGATANVNISGTGMANGSYVDTVTGNTFTVSNGTLSGTIGKSGVAVVYKSTSTPKATSSKESGAFEGETLTVKLGLENAVSGTYALEDSAPVTFTGTPTIRIGSDYSYGDTITLNLTATDAAGQTESYVYKYKKTEHSGSGVYVFFNAAQKSTWKGPFSAYIYDEVTHATQNATYSNAAGWPGEEMQYDEASGYYYVEVPSKAYKTTKNFDGTSTVSSEPVDFNLGTSSNTYVIICGYLKSTGAETQSSSQKGQKLNKTSQIYGTRWATTTLVPGGNVEATNVTKGAPAPTTVAPQPTTAAPQPTTQAQPVTTGGDKLTVNVKSNVIFGNRTETFDAGTKRITVAYYIKSNKLMVNDQWKLTWDPSVLKYCDEDGVNKKDLVIDGEVLGTTYYNTPITDQSVINGEKVGIGQLIGNVSNAGTYYPMRSLDTSGNGNIGILYATFDVIGSGSTDVNLDFVELQTKDGQIVQYSKMVEGAPDFPYTSQASVYEGLYDANYVNSDQPEPTTAAPQPTTEVPEPTDPQPTTPDPGEKYYYGDVNGDGICDIMDSTIIQKYAASKTTLDALQLILGDVNGDGIVDIMDATLVQKYSADRPGTKKCGQEYISPDVPTQPTEVQPTASGEGLTVTAKSTCLFDTRQETFSADTKQITVSFYVKSSELMVNDQWKITWDPSVLKYNEDEGVNKKDLVFDGEVLGTTYYNTPITDQSVINGAKVAQGQLIGNVTNAGTYYPMRDTDGDKIGLLTVTFDVIGSGSTEVNLDMVELQTKNGQVIMYSKFVDGQTFNGTTQTSIYAGKYNPDFVNPDTPQPTTEVQPVTQAQPTTEVQPVTDPEPTETDPIPTEGEQTFKLTDNFGWGSAYVYAWDADGNAIGGEWPGTAQAETVTNGYGETQFVCHVPKGAVGVILNNGNGAQTEDITDFGYDGYWMDGTKNDLGHYKVTGYYEDEPITYDTQPTSHTISNESFKLTDNFGWGAAYVYAWDADGNPINGEWPGAAQAETVTNGYGETQFICHVPEGAVGVILSNGNGAQTEDITDFSHAGYWMDGSKNDLGHYLVTAWD